MSRLRGNVSPRYDVPKAAPEPLRQVQLFLNTVDLHSGDDWLADWLAQHGGACDDARCDEQGALAPGGDPGTGEAEREHQPSEQHQYIECIGV